MKDNLDLKWQKQEVIPTLITGNDALEVYNYLPEPIKKTLIYDEASKTVLGSNPFAVSYLNPFVQQFGARTPNLRDLSRPELMEIADKGKHYINARNLVVRSLIDTDEIRNNSLLKKIYELAEEKQGNIKEPFMIDGFDFTLNLEDKTGYQLDIFPYSYFKIISDERFKIEHHGKLFSEVDELGLPKFDSHGKRSWYTKKKGLSSLVLSGGLNIYSTNDSLEKSNETGRIILLK